MLTIELVPKTCWYTNVRSELTAAQWDHLRRNCYREAGYKCQVCGGKGSKWPVECHEIWNFDDENKIQTLEGLIGLCPKCHEVKHIGLAGVRGRASEAREHLAEVNKCTLAEARRYITDAFRVWEERSLHEWELDISWVESHLP